MERRTNEKSSERRSLQLLLLFGGQDGQQQTAQVGVGKDAAHARRQGAIDPQHGRRSGHEQQVGSAALHRGRQQLVQQRLVVRSFPPGGAVELVHQPAQLAFVFTHAGRIWSFVLLGK